MQCTLRVASGPNLPWYRSMEWNMEWKIFSMEWKKISSMEYKKNCLPFHIMPCLPEQFAVFQ